jgi:hypothetical protein
MYPDDVEWSIASLPAGALVIFAINRDIKCQAPTPPSLPVASPVILPKVGESSCISWGADLVSPPSVDVIIDQDPAGHPGWVVDQVTFEGQPARMHNVKVAPGTTVKGTARFHFWNGGDCPSCNDQITYGIGVAVDYLHCEKGSPFPGSTGSGSFTVTSPTAPGVYLLRAGFAQEATCDNAKGGALEDTIATLVVE